MESGSRELVVTRAQVEDVFAHAQAEKPNECCGLFAGAPGEDRVEVVYRLGNADESPLTYRLDSREQIRTLRDAESRGLEVTGCFHSHTQTEAYPSQTDVRQAFEPEWVYALVSLKFAPPVLRAYRIVDGEITEIPVVVTD